MSTLVYAPASRITIATARHGVLDVTDDISSGTLNLRTAGGGGSNLTFVLTNQSKKYDGVFTPNDRIVVHLKRIKWLQVFSGYLDAVPIVSVYAKSVSLSASDTLKRLAYSLYDQGTAEVQNLVREAAYAGEENIYTSVDSNMGNRIIAVLSELAGWDPAKIHMGKIPIDWYESVKKLHAAMEEQWDADLNLGTTVGGSSLLNFGSTRVQDRPRPGDGVLNQQPEVEQGPGYGILPTLGGRIGKWGDEGHENQTFNLIGSQGPIGSGDTWFCSMRWPYEFDPSGPLGPGGNSLSSNGLTSAQVLTAKNWWNQRRILVVNANKNTAIVVRAVSWGPNASSGRVIDVSPAALAALGAETGDAVEIRFADPDLPLGVIDPNKPDEPTDWLDGYRSPTLGSGNPWGNSSAGDFGSVDTSVLDFDSKRKGGRGNLGNTEAAITFIKATWPDQQNGIGSYRSQGSVSTSDHPKGLALDIVISEAIGKEPSFSEIANGNSIAYWFIANADAFGTKYVIWNNLIYRAAGVKPYKRSDGGESGVTLGHRDHVHVSFFDTGQTTIGQANTPLYAGVSLNDFLARAASGGVIHNDKASSIPQPQGSVSLDPSNLFTSWDWNLDGNPDTVMYSGARIFMNDRPVSGLVNSMMASTMREYCAAPNGDILAWFPDYFNLYGTLARMVVQTIELEDFQVTWGDRGFITHQFVTGNPYSGYGGPGASAAMATRRRETHGIASIEYPELLETLLNIDRNDPATAGWIDPEAILNRFGVRVASEEMPWAATPQAEFWAAVHKFRMAWASQFSTKVPISFMPELFPGMILQIPEFGIQMYVDGVTHNWNVGPNGNGFSTSALAVAPSTIGSQPGLYGLPRGGSWVGAQERGPAYNPNVDTRNVESPFRPRGAE